MTLTIQGTAIHHCRNYGLKDYTSNNPPATSIPTQFTRINHGICEASFLRCYRIPNSPEQAQHNVLINLCTFAYFAAYYPYWQHQLGTTC